MVRLDGDPSQLECPRRSVRMVITEMPVGGEAEPVATEQLPFLSAAAASASDTASIETASSGRGGTRRNLADLLRHRECHGARARHSHRGGGLFSVLAAHGAPPSSISTVAKFSGGSVG